jgi:hypothetical protein
MEHDSVLYFLAGSQQEDFNLQNLDVPDLLSEHHAQTLHTQQQQRSLQKTVTFSQNKLHSASEAV